MNAFRNLRNAAIGIAAACLATTGLAHDDAAEAGKQAGERLGHVSFPISCAPAVQPSFERGVAMVHSYWFPEAAKVFAAIQKQDPECAMAYWGQALNALGNTLSAPPQPKDLQAGAEALATARALGAKTARERDWIEALGEYYRDSDKSPVEARLLAYERAMGTVAQRYPDDYEAQVYYALTLQASAPKTDTKYANQLKSAAILEKLYLQSPQHPGVSHYLIHAYDYPPLADKGLAAARRYAGIAPAAPHARHMPSHIYSMLGLWEDSIASNASALQVQPDYFHAVDFTVYAHLQLAQDAKAKALADDLAAARADGRLAKSPVTLTLGGTQALTVIPVRFVLERGDWAGAAALPVHESRFPQADALTRFARGLGMARSGDIAGAKGEIEALTAHRAALEKASQSYWAERTEEKILAVSAWVAKARGAPEEALKFMRTAADLEDGSVKHVTMENRVYPMRELLAELLAEMGQPAAALREYEASLKENPNRYRGLYGAARAAEAANDTRKAALYYGMLSRLAGHADSERPEIAIANKFLAKR